MITMSYTTKMKRLRITVFLFVFATLNLFSQDKNIGAELSEIRKNKNHLELDVKNIFNGLGNATLLYKRTFQSGELIDVNSIRLIRFLGRINNQITLTDDPARQPGDTSNVRLHPSDLINFQLAIGFERQKMNKNFVHYYGVDGVIEFLKSDGSGSVTIGRVANNFTGSGNDRFIKSIRTGLNPFIGIKYYFTNRLSIGMETGISILYFSQSVAEARYEQKVVNGQLEKVFVKDEPSKSQGIWTGFNNLRFLTIGYTF